MRKGLVHVAVGLCALACTRDQALPAPSPATGVALRHRVLQPRTQQNLQALAPGPARHLVVQLRGTHAPSGLTLLHALGNHAFTARLAQDVDARDATRVVAAWDVLPSDKAHPALLHPPDHARVGDATVVVAALWPGVDGTRVQQALETQHVAAVVTLPGQMVATVDARRLATLLEHPDVMWVEPGPPPPTPDMPRALAAVGQPAVLAAPFGLTGQGVTVSVHDTGHVFAHADVVARLALGDVDAGQPLHVQLHATMTAGTIGGDGQLDGGVPGVATRARLVSYDFTSTPCCLANQQQDVAHAAASNVAVATNAWGYADCALAPYGAYTAEAAGYDQLALGSPPDAGGLPPLLMVFSAGNERKGVAGDPTRQGCLTQTLPPFANYGTVNQPKAAKNVLVVGAVDGATRAMSAFSGWGPSGDGRLKPDLVAPGLHAGAVLDGGVADVTNCFGTPTGAANQQCYRATNTSNTSFGGYAWFSATSAAAAVVSGAVALLTQQWRQVQVPASSENPPPHLMRAVLVHTAQDLDDATTWFNPGPDHASGYGLLDVTAAATLLRAGPVVRDCVGQGDVRRYAVPNAAVVGALKATLAWDDLPGTPLAAGPNLVNDLDLRVFAPDGARAFPWTLNANAPREPAQQTAEDHLNNLEQVVAAPSAVAGDWRIEVVGTLVTQGSQCFALALSPTINTDGDGDGSPLPLDCDDANNAVYPGAPQVCDAVNNNCLDPAWPSCAGGDCSVVCNDNSACTVLDRCVAGVCVGDALACEDGNPCTATSCNPLTGCTSSAVLDGTPCQDANACNGAETCAAGQCTAGVPLVCGDTNPCTVETCDPLVGCVVTPVMDGASCADGTVCNGAETCVSGACVPSPALQCEDANPCTVDQCDPVTGCAFVAVMDGTPCLDGTVCNGEETCQAGQCVPGTALSCGDTNPCTAEACDAVTGCVSVPVMNGAPCVDANVCNGVETCQQGSCTPGTPVDCTDAGPAPDAALPADAALPVDGSTPVDAALPFDAGSSQDAASPVDAAVPLDAGGPGDASPVDAAVVALDAGAVSRVDASAAAPQPPPPEPSRCACAAVPGPGSLAMDLTALLVVLHRLGRRRNTIPPSGSKNSKT